MDNDLISRSVLLEAYDAAHKGPPGGERELIQEAPGVGGWMSVDDKLPAVGAQCLVVHEPVYLNETDVTICRKIMISAYIECGKEHFFVDLRSPLFPVPVVLNKVTHWMLLPELPKEAEDDAEQ